ncbi:MAG: UDP-N-acetylmuramoyl-L-alanyl-D-glutamate--2,6-diaminopimelate ligase [Candidatus Saccharibacteria bacterium]
MINIRKIVKKLIPQQLFKQIEPYGHLVESVIMNIIYGFPSHKMHIIGVTGTNGKTTTTFLIQKMLHTAGFKVGMLSTVAYGAGDDIKNQIKHMTTTESSILQSRLRDFYRQGVEWVVVETSSHALAQYRVWGLRYEVAVMTNVTNDHLDYHGTFDNYLEAKRRLFKIAARFGRKFGVVNADDPNAVKFTTSTPRSVSYGIGNGDLQAKNVKLATDHSTYQAVVGDDKYDIRINIPGDFNVSNSLAAIAVGREIGLDKKQIETGIAALKNVEGRMTTIDEGQKFKVIIDFASTPDAFERFFESVRPLVKGKLIAVFGSAGRRDEAKRAIQGEIAGRYSEEVVLTEEDDRDVDGNEILAQIASGAAQAGKVADKDMFLILDRAEAIKFALGRAKNADDTVVILGKGHEKTLERATETLDWSDIAVTKEALKSLKN